MESRPKRLEPNWNSTQRLRGWERPADRKSRAIREPLRQRSRNEKFAIRPANIYVYTYLCIYKEKSYKSATFTAGRAVVSIAIVAKEQRRFTRPAFGDFENGKLEMSLRTDTHVTHARTHAHTAVPRGRRR